jgi:hypothetical protein
MRKAITLIFALLIAGILVTGCSDPPNTVERQEQQRQQSIETILTNQPGYNMKYSPGRNTLNEWGRAMDDPNKPLYVYLFDSVGHKIMYFVIEGPPVSYCASLLPSQKLENADGGDGYDMEVPMPAPSQDGLFYVAGNCTQMIGLDYNTGEIVEWTGGGSFNQIVLESPAVSPEFQDFPQGGPTSLDNVKDN